MTNDYDYASLTLSQFVSEYGLGSKPSTSGDVYSFGILLLEMLVGKKPTDEMFKEGLSLTDVQQP